MKATKLRDLSDSELEKELDALKRALFNLRLHKATGALEKPHKLGEARRDIARVETIISERRRAASEGEA